MYYTAVLYSCTQPVVSSSCSHTQGHLDGLLDWYTCTVLYRCSVQVYRTCYLTLVLPHPGSKQHEDDLLGGLGGGLAGFPADLAQGRPPAVPVTVPL